MRKFAKSDLPIFVAYACKATQISQKLGDADSEISRNHWAGLTSYVVPDLCLYYDVKVGRKMVDFSDLEAAIAQELWQNDPIEVLPIDELQTRTHQFQTATLDEIRDLMESAVESYALLSASLPTSIQQNARREIEFLETLFRERLTSLILPFCRTEPSLSGWQIS